MMNPMSHMNDRDDSRRNATQVYIRGRRELSF